MGGNTSCLRHSSEPKSAEASDIKSKSPKRSGPDDDNRTRRYEEKQHHKNLKKQKELMMKPRGSLQQYSQDGFKSPRKKIHPSSSRQVHRRLMISEAKDSMCLDRPMMISSNYCKQEEEEGKSECLSASGKEEKRRVRFKLPHVVILYSPEEEHHHGYYCNTTSEDSFCLTLEENCRGGSFDQSPDESCFTLAVNTLPNASFSSGF